MKSKILIGFLILMIIESTAQSSKIKVIHNEKTIGKELISQNEIKANEYVFPKRIHDLHIDSSTGYITLELRKLSKNKKILGVKGTILVYNPMSKSVKWSKKIDYSTGWLNQYNNIIIQTKRNKINRLNIENGETLWSIKNNLYYINSFNKIGVGYKYKGLAGNLHTLEGIDLTNGATLWEKELNREYGWNKTALLDDSTLLITAGGLHTINFKNGSGWDYNTITGKKDYTEFVAKNVAGIALGVLTGTAIVSSANNLVKDVLSNTIIDSTYIYLASKEKISKIDKKQGKVVWSCSLPDDLTSKSSIFIKDGLLYMINKGYAYWGNKRIDFGRPFITALDKETGTQKYFISIGEDEDFIFDFKIANDNLVLILKDKIVTYSLINGMEIFSKTFDTDAIGELRFFVDNRFYKTTKDSRITNLVLSDTSKNYVQTSTDKTLELDTEFNITNQFDFDQLYFHYLNYHNYKFLLKEDQTLILNSDNQVIAELFISDKSYLIGNKLYDINDKSLLEVDLSKFIKN